MDLSDDTSGSLIVSCDSNPELICSVSSNYLSYCTSRGFTNHILNSVLFWNNLFLVYMLFAPLNSLSIFKFYHSVDIEYAPGCIP